MSWVLWKIILFQAFFDSCLIDFSGSTDAEIKQAVANGVVKMDQGCTFRNWATLQATWIPICNGRTGMVCGNLRQRNTIIFKARLATPKALRNPTRTTMIRVFGSALRNPACLPVWNTHSKTSTAHQRSLPSIQCSPYTFAQRMSNSRHNIGRVGKLTSLFEASFCLCSYLPLYLGFLIAQEFGFTVPICQKTQQMSECLPLTAAQLYFRRRKDIDTLHGMWTLCYAFCLLAWIFFSHLMLLVPLL